MRTTPAVLIGATLLPLLLAGAVILVVWVERRRRAAFRAWAAAIGWQYRQHGAGLERRWRGRPFATGSARRATDVLTGTFHGRPATSFRYQYTTGAGKHRRTSFFSVVAVGLPVPLPTLELTPEDVAARIAKALGGQDIQFESEAFNRAWRVTSRNASFAHAVVSPQLMERLLRPDAAGTNLRIEGSDLLSWTPAQPWGGWRGRLSRLAPTLALLTDVVEHVPRFVWQENGYDPLTRPSEAP